MTIKHYCAKFRKSAQWCRLGATRRIKQKLFKKLNLTKQVTCHAFAQTTHVVMAPCGFARAVAIYARFHRNPFRGFGDLGGHNLSFPITWAIGFYDSWYYHTSCHNTKINCEKKPSEASLI